MSTQKYLSDVLSATDIIDLETNKVCIISGVGSGKNYFIEHELAEYGNILYVTSRRAKVNEILADKICQERVNWNKLCGDVVITTNYGIELLVKNRKFNSGMRNIAEHFQFVVIDEAHSIYTDATFTDSSFHVWKFVEYITAEYRQIKVILMTGTPEPFFPEFLKDYQVFDKREECINVQPKAIKIVTQKQAVDLIRALPEDEKTIYYSNSATKLVTGDTCFCDRLIDNEGLALNKIAFCMNDEKAKTLSEDNPFLSIEKNVKETKEYIAQNHMLPESTSVLLTTSTLREGVNLKDENIKIAFCESHLLSDIQQFAGRVRNGLDVLYVVENAQQHCIDFESLRKEQQDLLESVFYGIESKNEYLERFITGADAFDKSPVYVCFDYGEENLFYYRFAGVGDFSLFSMGNTAVRDHINLTESNHKYIRFNHLSGRYELYVARINEYMRTNKLLLREDWKENLKQFALLNNMEYEDLAATEKMTEGEFIEILEGVLDEKLAGQAKKEIISVFKRFFRREKTPKLNTINKLLKKKSLPYRIKKGTTSQSGKSIRYIQITKVK